MDEIRDGPSDLILLEGWKSESAAAQERLLRAHGPAVQRVLTMALTAGVSPPGQKGAIRPPPKVALRARGGIESIVHDLYQDTFLEFHRKATAGKLDQVAVENRLRAWLCRCARNKALNLFRRMFTEARGRNHRQNDAADNAAHDQRAQDREIEVSTAIQRIRNLLSDDEFFLLASRDGADTPIPQLSAKTGQTNGAMRKRLTLIRNKLRKLLLDSGTATDLRIDAPAEEREDD